MAVEYHVGDVDLASIFKAKVKTGTSAVGYDYQDADIGTIFEAYRAFASQGSTTGYKVGDQDLNAIFLKIDVPIVDGSDWPFSDTTMVHAPAAGETCYAYIYAGAGGTFSITQEGVTSGQVYDWLDITGTGNGDNHYVKYTLNSGDTPTYGNLTTSYQSVATLGNWYLGWQNQSVSRSANITISIAETATGTNAVHWTADWTLTYTAAQSVAWTTTDHTILTQPAGTTVQTGIRFLTDGNTERTATSTGSWIGHTYDWGDPAGGCTGADFQIMYDSFSGDPLDVSIGTSGQWYTLGSVRTMQYYANGTTMQQCSFDIHIRKGTDNGTMVECTVTLQQTYDS